MEELKNEITTEQNTGAETQPEAAESMADYAAELEASFRKIKEGDIITGTVISVDEEEVIVDLRYYTQGVLKAEDFSNDPDFSVLEEVKTGDVIEAAVVSMDDGNGNIRLSKKEANEVLGWEKLQANLEEETDLTVKVKEAVRGGVVAYVEGIRGFIPASQLALTYVEEDELESFRGKTLKVRVITVDKEKEKLVLSAKVVEKEAAKEEQNHKISMIVPGSILEGTVENLTNYGAFVALKDGLSGLVHISEICTKRIRKPSEVLSVGEKVRVKVLNTRDNKISLSIKAVEEEMATDEIDDAEGFEYSSGEEATTTLGDLFAKLKF